MGRREPLLDGERMQPGQKEHGWRTAPGQGLRVLRDQDAHFMCSFYPEWPSGPPTGWKFPPNGDCRDQLGLNAVLAMLRRACVNRASQKPDS